MSPFFYIMRLRYCFSFCLFVALFAACAAPAATPTPIQAPTAPVTRTIPTAAAAKTPVVVVTPPYIVDTHPGARATLLVQFKPMHLEIGKTASGATYTSLSPWDNAGLAQMRVCMQFDKACEPGDTWTEYKTEWTQSFETDWLGERTVWIGAQVRDAAGHIIPIYSPGDSAPAQELGSIDVTAHSVVDERTPIAAQPAFVQTAVAATRTAFPVTGSVILQNGACCVGGKTGSTVEINAAFQAASPNTTVTQMRLLNHCSTVSEMNTAAWEPLVKQKTFPYTINVSNWVGWYLAVQYRDANGNLSPVYCDDISVEGMPQ